MQHAYEIMYRYASAEKVRPFVRPLTMQGDLRIQQGSELQYAMRGLPMRAAAFALAEVAFLVCLCSADNLVSLAACNCLRLLAQVERQPNAAQQTEVNEEEILKRHPIYEQLGDPKVSMIGMFPITHACGYPGVNR